MVAYYNEFDPKAAAWLRELIKAGLIAGGDVDERSIEDISPTELVRYTQCHFFAGIGTWSLSLRRAGWPDDRPIWTGSCPCQPFSASGKGKGFADERHLWPSFYWLISQCRPGIVIGEQVASKDAEPWLDLVQADVEGLGYAFGACAFPSAGVGAPHIRDRTYWVADAQNLGYQRDRHSWGRGIGPQDLGAIDGLADADSLLAEQPAWQRTGPGQAPGSGSRGEPERHGDTDGLDDTIGSGLERHAGHGGGGDEPGRLGEDETGPIAATGGPGVVVDTDGSGQRTGEWDGASAGHRLPAAAAGLAGGLALADGGDTRAEWQQRGGEQRQQPQDGGTGGLANAPSPRHPEAWQHERGPSQLSARSAEHGGVVRPTGPVNGLWRSADWLLCRDGRWRPVEPGTFPLAHGAPARVGRLRGYGNAVNAEAAQTFVEAYLEATGER